MATSAKILRETHPKRVNVEGIWIDGFSNVEDLFHRVLLEIKQHCKSVIYHLNVHGANLAHQLPEMKAILNQGDLVYCDGAGVVLASKLLGHPLPARHTAADWFIRMLEFYAAQEVSIYILAGEPWVSEKAFQELQARVPQHSIVGMHHGYILNNQVLEDSVIQEINRLKPDLLFVGFGMPLQERWIQSHQEQLEVKAIWAIGATLDYLVGKVQRCPEWMGKTGLEWLFRFLVEPKRLFHRYIIGNPQFLARILWQVFQNQVKSTMTSFTKPKRTEAFH